jgi:hypothetical protein
MQVTIKHPLSEVEAITRVKKLLQESKSQMAGHVSDITEDWQGNILNFAFTAQGYHIEGTLTVKDKEFDLYAKLPLTLRLFEGRIEKMIKEQAEAMLGSQS